MNQQMKVVLVKKEIADYSKMQENTVSKEEAMYGNDEFREIVKTEDINDSSNMQYSSSLCEEVCPPFEVVLVKEGIAFKSEIKDENVSETEEVMHDDDEFSTLENPENINGNMQDSSSISEECHMENFLSRVKKETELNLIHEEIQIKYEQCALQDENDLEEEKAVDENDCSSTSFEDGEIDRLQDQNKDSAKRYKCDQCHKLFSYPSYLQVHSRIHTGEKPYECDICHKTFNRNNNLAKHKRIHNNERPFKCSVCNKTFIENGHLSVHLRTHTGEKPFQCQICQFKCTRASNLKMHLRIHTGEKPFTCIHCHRAFNDPSHLKRHIRTKHSDKI